MKTTNTAAGGQQVRPAIKAAITKSRAGHYTVSIRINDAVFYIEDKIPSLYIARETLETHKARALASAGGQQ